MKSIEEVVSDNSQIAVIDAIKTGWQLVSKSMGLYIVAFIVMIAISVVSSFIPIIGSLANGLILSPGLTAGFILVSWMIHKGEGWSEFGKWFKGFDYIKDLIIQAAIYLGVVMIISVALLLKFIPQFMELMKLSSGAGAMSNQEEIRDLMLSMLSGSNILMFLLAGLIIAFVSIIWIFRMHFVVVYKMSAWPSMEASRKVAQRNFLQLIAFFILIFIINAAGAMACGLGLLVTVPLTYTSLYAAFAQLTDCGGLMEENV